jgi:hypothetical protein
MRNPTLKKISTNPAIRWGSAPRQKTHQQGQNNGAAEINKEIRIALKRSTSCASKNLLKLHIWGSLSGSEDLLVRLERRDKNVIDRGSRSAGRKGQPLHNSPRGRVRSAQSNLPFVFKESCHFRSLLRLIPDCGSAADQ